MGAKSKSKSKKKGPKGRKARAKAKLDAVWGETYDEEKRNASKIRPGGKSRLTQGAKNGKNGKVEEVDPLYEKRRGIATPFDKFLERKEQIQYNNGQQQQKKQFRYEKKNHYYGSSDESSSGEEEEDSDDEMNNNGAVGGGGSLATLLQRINGPKKQSRSKRMAIDSDDDVTDSDDDSTESDDDDGNESESSDESDDDSDADMKDADDNEEENMSNEKTRLQTNNTTITAEDPYEAHFSKPALPQLDSLQQSSTTQQLVPHVGNNRKVSTTPLLNSASTDVQMSGPLLDSWDKLLSNNKSENGEKKSPKKKQQGTQLATKKAWDEFSLGPYQHVRQVLSRNWKTINKSALKRSSKKGRDEEEGAGGKVFSSLQSVMYPAVSRYADVMISSETRQNRNEINNLLSMHILNHVLTSRTRVQRHNRRIKELGGSSSTDEHDAANNDDDEGDEDKWRDQGYTRPKVLILLPTRGTCWNFVQSMIQLLGESAIVDNGDRFDAEYGPLDSLDDSDDDKEEDANAKARRAAVLKQKGAEWNDLFGDDANNDDDFKMGMSLTPNAVKSAGGKKKGKAGNAGGASGVKVKLFAEFYHSDIILASPIGLKMATTGNEDGDEEEEDAEADVDFLSSIDICLVGRSDVLLMQNWDHVNGILTMLNQQPKKITDIDFSRVRNYFLEGQGAHWRQTIVVSQFADPYMLSTFRRHAKNVEGQLKIRRKVSAEDASICDVMVRVKQVFQRVSCLAVSEAGAHRLRYFSDHVLPKLIRLKQKHTLIYIPSYFDFIAVRNLLLKQEVDFVSVTEYARVSEVSRGRARFLQGRKSIMLYTGRAHFFLRHKIKGARHVIFFGIPEYADFYPAVVNMLNEGLSTAVEDDSDGGGDISRMPMSCLSLFTKFDAHQLERIVGTSHTERMIKGEKSSYMFCS